MDIIEIIEALKIELSPGSKIYFRFVHVKEIPKSRLILFEKRLKQLFLITQL